MIKRLLIIGNGFDISHDIPTRYEDFKNYLMLTYNIEKNPTPIISSSEGKHGEIIINQYESAKVLVYGINTTDDYTKWSKFESDLANMDFLDLVPDRDWYLDKDGDPDESYYSGVFESHFYDFSCMIGFWKNFFNEWIEEVNDGIIDSLDYYVINDKIKSLLDDDTIVLTFNYTETVERLYDFKNVVHIHNKVGEELVWGHGDEIINTSDMYEYDENKYNAIVVNMYKKDVYSQINKHIDFFESLDGKTIEIFTFGFDYSDVDLPYISEIINKISDESVWNINDFGQYSQQEKIVKDLGFKGKILCWNGNMIKKTE